MGKSLMRDVESFELVAMNNGWGDYFESSNRDESQQPKKDNTNSSSGNNKPKAKQTDRGEKQVHKTCNHCGWTNHRESECQFKTHHIDANLDASISFKQSTKGKAYSSMFKDERGTPLDSLRWPKSTTGQQQSKPLANKTSSSNPPTKTGIKRNYEHNTGSRERSGSRDRSSSYDTKSTSNTNKKVRFNLCGEGKAPYNHINQCYIDKSILNTEVYRMECNTPNTYTMKNSSCITSCDNCKIQSHHIYNLNNDYDYTTPAIIKHGTNELPVNILIDTGALGAI